MSIALVTDSPAYLPPELARAHGIRVVPLHVVLAGREYAEGVEITVAEVAEALRGFRPVTTSRPTPEAFAAAYRAAAEAGATAVVSVQMSAELSSTIGSAHLAAPRAPVPVTVIDSRTLGMAMGFAVLAGARVAEAGADAARVSAVVRARCRASTVLFYVDTLEYLRRGGRIGKASALLGTALSIKPLLGLQDGQIVPIEKVRTSGRALGRLAELAADAVRAAPLGAEVAVHHLDAPERAGDLARRLGEALPQAGEIPVVELGAVLGAHVGPGTIAVAVSPRVDGEPVP